MTSEWKAVFTLDIDRPVELLMFRIQNAVVDARTRQSFTGGRPEPSTGKVALTAGIMVVNALELGIHEEPFAAIDARTKQSFTGRRLDPSTGKDAPTAGMMVGLCVAKASNDLFNWMKESKRF